VLEWGGRMDPADAQQDAWPKHLHLLRRIMMTLPAKQGVDLESGGGAMVRAIDRELVRTEFYRNYPAEGDTEEKRQNNRRQRFFTAIKNAQERNLIGVRVVGETTYLWIAMPE
jgi:hypothetical protein